MCKPANCLHLWKSEAGQSWARFNPPYLEIPDLATSRTLTSLKGYCLFLKW